MVNNASRKRNEKLHGEEIQNNADKIWGWGTAAGKIRVKRRIEEFLRYLRPKEKNKILEIGCGTGVFTACFYEKGLRPIAVDISYDLLKKAKSKSPHLVFIQADAENLPFKKNTFHYVVGVSVLHHLDIHTVLDSIQSVLRSGGMAIFSEPNMVNPQIFLQKHIGWLKKMMSDIPTEAAFYRWQLKAILRKKCFSRICVYPFEFLHPLTPEFLIGCVKKMERCLERIPLVREISGSLLITARKRECE